MMIQILLIQIHQYRWYSFSSVCSLRRRQMCLFCEAEDDDLDSNIQESLPFAFIGSSIAASALYERLFGSISTSYQTPMEVDVLDQVQAEPLVPLTIGDLSVSMDTAAKCHYFKITAVSVFSMRA